MIPVGSRAEPRLFAVFCALLLTAEIFTGAGMSAHAQSAEQDWEKAAGGKQQFEVASVRENKGGGRSYSNFSLDNGNAYFVINKNDKLDLNGTLFSAKNQSLMRYIIFAYKLSGTQELALRFDYFKGLELHVPGWVKDDGYDIEARAEAPVFALVLEKPGKLGPQLERHTATDDCSATAFPEDAAKSATPVQSLSKLPIPCGHIAHLPPGSPGANRFG